MLIWCLKPLSGLEYLETLLNRSLTVNPMVDEPEDQRRDPFAAEDPATDLSHEEKDAYTWGMLCHLSALTLLLGIPFGNILGPLVVWLMKRHDYEFVETQGKASLNFEISITLYYLIAAASILFLIGLLILPLLFILHIVLVVVASVKASNGESYQYPLTIKFIQ